MLAMIEVVTIRFMEWDDETHKSFVFGVRRKIVSKILRSQMDTR